MDVVRRDTGTGLHNSQDTERAAWQQALLIVCGKAAQGGGVMPCQPKSPHFPESSYCNDMLTEQATRDLQPVQ